MAISTDEVVWAYRCLLGREATEADIQAQIACSDFNSFRSALLNTGEFKSIHNQPYNIPNFLVPSVKNGVIEIAVPTLENPVSQMCTAEQAAEPYYKRFCETAGYPPEELHRKYWEWAYIYRVIEHAGLLGRNARGLVFAVGTEPLPAMFVSQGCQILASDGPQEAMELWQASGEYSKAVENLFKSDICSSDLMRDRVEFRTIDMLNLPDDISEFDFIWSSCSLEHLGGIEPGLNFIREAMRYLKPGGLAVHTTEFNLLSNDATIDGWPTCIFRKQDIERLAQTLTADGHSVRELNFWPGSEGERDSHIDFPPYGPPHLKLCLYQYVATSIGVVVTKGSSKE